MRLIHINDYNQDTMQLAKPIYDAKRRILLAAGRHIHPKFIDRLKGMNITHMFVEDHVSRGITLDELIDMPTWMDVIEAAKNAYEAVKLNKPIDIIAVQKAVGRLVLEVEKRPVIVLVPTSTINDELKPYAHSVNVALLSLQVGRRLMINQIQLKDLAIGALLHDIGKVKTTKEEDHPKVGFEIIRNIREFNLLIAHVAFQHHEALNGSGYPRGVTGNDFHQFAQICGVVNMYENMISEQNVQPNEAMERIMVTSGEKYDTKIVHALVQGVPAYPPGTKVKLSTGENAIVIRIESHMQRPVVRTIDDKEISLEDNPTVMINGIIQGES